MTTTTLTNDDRIILLKQKIEDKRTALKGANTRPPPYHKLPADHGRYQIQSAHRR